MACIKKDNSYCCVPQCTSKGSRNPNLSFHRFPNVQSKIKMSSFGSHVFVSRRDEWIRILRIGKTVSSRMCVCSMHFTSSDYNLPPNLSQRPRLKPSAVPSLFLPVLSTDTFEKNRLKQEKATERQTRYEEIKRKKENVPQKVTADILKGPDETKQGRELSQNEVSAIQALLSMPLQV